MSTFNAFYVRGGRSVAGAIRDAFPKAEPVSTPAWVGVEMGSLDFEPPEEELAALSGRLHTDVIWLGYQSAVDAFLFFRWNDGRLVRALVYGAFEERTWDRVEGERQEWERALLFSDEALESELSAEPEDPAEVRRVWEAAELLPGRTAPGLDAGEYAHALAAHYGFPHYEDPGTPIA